METMQRLDRRLNESVDRVLQVLQDELSGLLCELCGSSLDLSHPQFSAVAKRIVKASGVVAEAYKQHAVEMLLPHLNQFEDAPGVAAGAAEPASGQGSDSRSNSSRLPMAVGTSNDGDDVTALGASQLNVSSSERLQKLSVSAYDSSRVSRVANSDKAGATMAYENDGAVAQSLPLEAAIAALNNQPATSLSSPTGGADADQNFSGWVSPGLIKPGDSQNSSSSGTKDGTSTSGGQQEYLKNVRAALNAANIVMGDSQALSSLTESLQRASVSGNQPGNSSQQTSGRLVTLQQVMHNNAPTLQQQQQQLAAANASNSNLSSQHLATLLPTQLQQQMQHVAAQKQLQQQQQQSSNNALHTLVARNQGQQLDHSAQLVMQANRQQAQMNAQQNLQFAELYNAGGNTSQALITLQDGTQVVHNLSGQLQHLPGDAVIVEPLGSQVPDPNFSLYELQAANGSTYGGNTTLSMIAAAQDDLHRQQSLHSMNLQNNQNLSALGLGTVIDSSGQLVTINTGYNPQVDNSRSEPLPMIININGQQQLLQPGLTAGTMQATPLSAATLLNGGTYTTINANGQSPDPGLMSGQTINITGLLPGSGQQLGVSRPLLSLGVNGLGMAGLPVSPLPLRVQDLPGRFKILPVVVQQRILALCRTNPVIGVRDFDDKVVSKLSLLVDSWGVEQALAMLDHLEHRMRTKQGAMKNGPGYLDVAVCSHLDMLKAQGACPKSMKLEDYAQQVLAPPVYTELCNAVGTNRWLAWEHFDQGIVQLIKKLPPESAVQKLQEITYHSFKNVDNIKGCIMSILNSKIREDRRRQP